MKNILKLCLLLTLCASLLLVVGCAKKDVDGTQPSDQVQGTEENGANTGDVVDSVIGENPEGDPFDGIDAEGNLNAEGEPEETEDTEPPVDIEDDQGEEDDFVIDFGDLT